MLRVGLGKFSLMKHEFYEKKGLFKVESRRRLLVRFFVKLVNVINFSLQWK